MPKDRLTDLQKIRARNRLDSADSDDAEEFVFVFHDDIFNQLEPSNESMKRFLEQADQLWMLITELKEDVQKVKKLQRKILSSAIPDLRAKQELDQLMSTIKIHSGVIRSKLKDFESTVLKEEEESKGTGIVSADLRMQRTQHSALLQSFVAAMHDYSAAQIEYWDRCKARNQRYIKIAGGAYSDDDVERISENDSLAQMALNRGVFGHSEDQIREMLAHIDARHSDIMKLEKSIRELHDTFLEMAVLIERRGDIDRIENHVKSSQNAVEKVKKRVAEAREYQHSARQKQRYIVLMVAAIGWFGRFWLRGKQNW